MKTLTWIVILLALLPAALASGTICLASSLISEVFKDNDVVVEVCHSVIGFCVITVGQVYVNGVLELTRPIRYS